MNAADSNGVPQDPTLWEAFSEPAALAGSWVSDPTWWIVAVLAVAIFAASRR